MTPQQIVRLVAILSFLAVHASAAYAYAYAKQDCTGDIVGGTYASTDVCLPGANIKLTCNDTHLTQADCQDPTKTEAMALDNCTKGSKFFCSGSLNVPEAGKALFINFYPNAQCTSGGQLYQYQLLDVCSAKDGSGSTRFSKNSTTGKIDNREYASGDCSGDPVYYSSNDAETSYASDYVDGATTASGKVNLYTYDNPTCLGTPIAGTAILTDNLCNYKTGYECEGNTIKVYSYSDEECQGTKIEVSNVTVDLCVLGTKSSCSGSFNIPAKSQKNIAYSKGDCSNPTLISFQLIDACNDYEKISYDTSKKMFTRTGYANSDCTGQVEYADTSYIVSQSSGLSLSNAALSVTPSSFIFVFMMLALVIVRVIN